MLNVNQRLDGNKLILEIDLAQSHGPSSTGKTITVAKSGFAKVEHPSIPGAGFTLNVWKK